MAHETPTLMTNPLVIALQSEGYYCALTDRGDGCQLLFVKTPSGKQFDIDEGDEGGWMVWAPECDDPHEVATLADAITLVKE